MADEDPWVIEDPSESVPEEQPFQETLGGGGGGAGAVSDGGATGGETAKVEAGPEDHIAPEDDGYRKPVTLYKHWVRLVFDDD